MRLDSCSDIQLLGRSFITKHKATASAFLAHILRCILQHPEDAERPPAMLPVMSITSYVKTTFDKLAIQSLQNWLACCHGSEKTG